MNLDELAKKHDVCSFELSKELKEAGVPQDKSIWYWVGFYATPPQTTLKYCYSGKLRKELMKDNCPAALHSGELAEMLPTGITAVQLGNKFIPISVDSLAVEFYENLTTETLPNALARMVKYLLDKGIIKKEDL